MINVCVDGKYTVLLQGEGLTARGAKFAAHICYGENATASIFWKNIIYRVTPRTCRKIVTL